jgi:hypothetical protein
MSPNTIFDSFAANAGGLSLVLFCAGGLGCVQDAGLPHPGTRQMAARLDSIATYTDPRTYPYANATRVVMMKRMAPPADPNQRIALQRLLAQDLLLSGETEEAIELYEELRSQVEPPGVDQMLALAYLQLSVKESCIEQTIGSCLVPSQGAGEHAIQRGSRDAIRIWEEILAADPDDQGSRWLLNLAYMAAGEYPAGVPQRWRIPPRVFASEYDIGRFRDVAPEAGVAAWGLAGGAAVDDFDGDGNLDVVASSSGLLDQFRYFTNDGDGTFTERTDEAGLTGIVGGLNLNHADYDNDGYLDVLVLRGAWLGVPPSTDGGRHPNSLLRNRGDGTFEDVTEAAGILSFHPTQTAAWGDYDNDGWLDLFIGNESVGYDFHPCELYRNRGDGTFEEVAAEVGLAAIGLVKAVTWGDYDNDGRLDLYVSRLGTPNLLYHNDGPSNEGGWSFTEVGEAAGVQEPLRSFPTWFWDYDNDGWLDIFVSGYGGSLGGKIWGDVLADYVGEATTAVRPRLYRNNGDGTFTETSQQANVDKVVFTMGTNFGDLDNDGWLDFYVGTGDPDLRSVMPNRMFRNDGGRRFQEVTTSGGFGHLPKGHGVSFADIDNDGDQDVFQGLGGFFSVDTSRNALLLNPGHGNRWVTLRLRGVRSNRYGVGARIEVRVRTAGDSRAVYATVSSGGTFGDSSFQQEIGLGDAVAIEQIEVTWPTTGERQIFRDVTMDRAYQVVEGEPELVALELEPIPLGAGGHSAPSP